MFRRERQRFEAAQAEGLSIFQSKDDPEMKYRF
jgi:hypothetical protein